MFSFYFVQLYILSQQRYYRREEFRVDFEYETAFAFLDWAVTALREVTSVTLDTLFRISSLNVQQAKCRQRRP